MDDVWLGVLRITHRCPHRCCLQTGRGKDLIDGPPSLESPVGLSAEPHPQTQMTSCGERDKSVNRPCIVFQQQVLGLSLRATINPKRNVPEFISNSYNRHDIELVLYDWNRLWVPNNHEEKQLKEGVNTTAWPYECSESPWVTSASFVETEQK